MMNSLPPGIIILVGALALPLLPRALRAVGALALPIISLAHLILLSDSVSLEIEFAGLSLIPVRVDRLSLIFGYIFHIAAILAALYALHVRNTVEHLTAMLYVGSAIGAVFAGDLVTLFVYWEITALSSVFLIFASRTERSYRAGIRYLIIQVGSGVLLLSGILMHYQDVGSLAFGQLIGAAGSLSEASLGVWLIFLAFGIKCAFPFLHNWLQDAYPQATVTGAVFLSAFTMKLAIYALARGFPGTDALIGIGVVMTLFPIFFAVIENDLRKVLTAASTTNWALWWLALASAARWALGAVRMLPLHISTRASSSCLWARCLHRTGTIRALRSWRLSIDPCADDGVLALWARCRFRRSRRSAGLWRSH